VVIGYLGSLSFVIVYFGSLVCGSLLTILFHKDDYNYRAVGASGAVTGVLYSAILLQPDMMLSIFYNSYASLSLESSIYCILFTE
jgi:membrane associated rhomboid family serine protease